MLRRRPVRLADRSGRRRPRPLGTRGRTPSGGGRCAIGEDAVARDVGAPRRDRDGADRLLHLRRRGRVPRRARPGHPGERRRARPYADIRTLFALIPPDEIDDAWVGIVVPHELTHLVFDTASNNPYHFPPHWLNEGLAVYVSQGYDRDYRNAVEYRGAGRHADPARRPGRPVPDERRRFYLAYAESVSAVDYIVRTLRRRRAGRADPLVRRRADRRRGVHGRARRGRGRVRDGVAGRRRRHGARRATGRSRRRRVRCRRRGAGPRRPASRRARGVAAPARTPPSWMAPAPRRAVRRGMVVDRAAAWLVAVRSRPSRRRRLAVTDGRTPAPHPELADHARRRLARARLPDRRAARRRGTPRPVHDPGTVAAR